MRYDIPRITERIPTSYDYILTVWSLVAIFGLVVAKDYPSLLSSGLTQDLKNLGLTILISFPLWAWRSFRAVLFYKQSKLLSRRRTISIVVTNLYTYLFFVFIFWQIPKWWYGGDVSDLINFVITVLISTFLFRKGNFKNGHLDA